MPKDTSFHDYVVYDLLGDAQGVSSRAMFGGWGLYKDGVIFGIIVGTELYFKVGSENQALFEQMGSHPFQYSRSNRKKITMAYWFVPEKVMEDREALYSLIEKSVAIGRKKKYD